MFRLQHESVRLKSGRFFRDTKITFNRKSTTFNKRVPKTKLYKKMYILYTRWVICNPEMNFEVILVKGYARIETSNAKLVSIFCYMNHKRNCDTFYESCHVNKCMIHGLGQYAFDISEM
ncbi:hypothetical protein ALC53_09846 [Atta colombica]|uniref:Uncharacterized protein n=1 Tax=Atta colombica TaxID=520822 RepID=A0A195B6C5_9HYME|nr:hypothetical protein ALC53_09846 [Atta colombica]